MGKAQNTKSGFATHPTNGVADIYPNLCCFSLCYDKISTNHLSKVSPLCGVAGPRVSWSHCVSQESERNESRAQLIFSSIQLRNLACETVPPTFRVNPLTPLSPIKKTSLQSRPEICFPGPVKSPVNINYHRYNPLTWTTAKCPRQLQDWEHLVSRLAQSICLRTLVLHRSLPSLPTSEAPSHSLLPLNLSEQHRF